MKKIYSIGGAGNVFLQQIYMQNLKVAFTSSDFLVRGFVRRLLRHTDHSLRASDLFEIEASENYFYNILLIFDLMIGRFFGWTLFSTLDLRSIKARPLIRDLLYLGYFQEGLRLDLCNPSSLLRVSNTKNNLRYDLAIHIRGGDFKKTNNCLGGDYYRDAYLNLSRALDMTQFSVAVITDDKPYSRSIVEQIEGLVVYDLISDSPVQDFYLLAGASNLICSNSTYCLMAATNCSGIKVLPRLFFKKMEIIYDPESTIII